MDFWNWGPIAEQSRRGVVLSYRRFAHVRYLDADVRAVRKPGVKIGSLQAFAIGSYRDELDALVAEKGEDPGSGGDLRRLLVEVLVV